MTTVNNVDLAATIDDLGIKPAYDDILTLKAYQSGKPVDELTREYGIHDVLKLASNENPLGSSPTVTLAITKQLGELACYPDSNAFYLKQKIAKFTQIDESGITLGNGSNDLLDMIARTFVSCNDTVVYSQYAFMVYSMVTKIIGATGIEVPAKRYGHDLDAMLESIKSNPTTKLVFIANPNNPTGTLLSRDKVQEFMSQVPNHVLVVFDEAYIEYTPESNNKALLDEFANVIIVRTFSKAYGLAGLRIGYALSHPAIADLLNRIRQPFNVSILAQAAAKAALDDQEFIAKSYTLNERQGRWLSKQFDVLGLEFVPTHANFIMVNVGDGVGVYQALLEQGIIVRPLTGYGLPKWLRITIGVPEDNTHLIDTLSSVLA